jgi:hypothetical protein
LYPLAAVPISSVHRRNARSLKDISRPTRFLFLVQIQTVWRVLIRFLVVDSPYAGRGLRMQSGWEDSTRAGVGVAPHASAPRDRSCCCRVHTHTGASYRGAGVGTHQSVERGLIMFRKKRCKACAACRETATRSAEGLSGRSPAQLPGGVRVTDSSPRVALRPLTPKTHCDPVRAVRERYALRP